MRPIHSDENGFTIIEVMVAALVLVVGVLGSVALIDGANRTTTQTRSREGATNLARELTEAARGIAYEDLSPSTIEATLRSRAGGTDPDPATPGFTVTRRGVDYTVVVGLCAVDETRDRTGAHPAGVFCPGTPATDTVRPDRDPEDYKRLTIEATWRQVSGPRTVRQASVIPSGGPASGVRVTRLDPDPAAVSTSASSETVVTGDGPVGFTATTSRAAREVEWSVDGTDRGNATGSGTGWSFSWSVSSLADGAYVIGAQATDEFGRSASPYFVTIALNRVRPAAPTGFRGGRNGTVIDMVWDTSSAGDLVGYSVFRSAGGVETEVPGCQLVIATTCRDASPPSGEVTYVLRAYDRDPSTGSARAGDPASTVVSATPQAGNTAPSAPSLSGSATATSASLGWTASKDTDSGDSVQFYRVYRDGSPYATTELLGYTDSETGGVSHSYYVTAVDTYFLESAPSNTLTLAPPP